MKRGIYVASTGLIMSFMLAACSSDSDIDGGNGASETRKTITLPLYVNTTNGTPYSVDEDGNIIANTRATLGDPGVEELCPPPANLYVFVVAKMDNSNNYGVSFQKQEGLTYDIEEETGDWSLTNYTDFWGQPDRRYVLNNQIRVSLTNRDFPNMSATNLGRVFVIGTPTDKRLTDAAILTWFSSLTQVQAAINDPGNEKTLTNAQYNTFLNILQNSATVDCSTTTAWRKQDGTTADAWDSNNYRDLYSTPYNEAVVNGNTVNTTNGTFVMDASKNLSLNPIHLYHVAAKYDFQWEVPEELRTETSTTFIRNINLTNIPQVARVFNPTANTNAGTTMQVANFVANDAANTFLSDYADKVFIGREYVYGFQPTPSGVNTTVNYTVGRQTTTLSGGTPSYNKSTANHTSTFTPNAAFTTWLRVRATVK